MFVHFRKHQDSVTTLKGTIVNTTAVQQRAHQRNDGQPTLNIKSTSTDILHCNSDYCSNSRIQLDERSHPSSGRVCVTPAIDNAHAMRVCVMLRLQRASIQQHTLTDKTNSNGSSDIDVATRHAVKTHRLSSRYVHTAAAVTSLAMCTTAPLCLLASIQVVHYIWHDSVHHIPIERVHVDPHSATEQKGTHVHTAAAYVAVRYDLKRCNMKLQVQEVEVVVIGESLLPEETCNQCALASSSSVALVGDSMHVHNIVNRSAHNAQTRSYTAQASST
eukprot:13501-Heterococcus_DN1.PRE.4